MQEGEKQIMIHLHKQKNAVDEGKIELADYYAREIAAKKKDLQRKNKTL